MPSLHHALLRPAVVQILRSNGFHSATPTALDVLTEILAKYLSLLAVRATARARENHNGPTPDITDVRMAMVDCGLLTPTATATQEVWNEILRTPLEEIPARNGLRDVQADIRHREDTGEIDDFIAWVRGPENVELRRIAGVARDGAANEPAERAPDYLTGLWIQAAVNTGLLTTVLLQPSKQNTAKPERRRDFKGPFSAYLRNTAR
jgi:transcription initiation factor TFIID subunit 3